MTTPSVHPTVVEALADVMADVQKVGKDSRNREQGYPFRGIDAVVNAVGPALRTRRVIVVPLVEDYVYDTVTVGQKQTRMGHARLTVRYRFHGPAGDSLDAVAVGEAFDAGDKATPKAMSVAFRTCLLQALCLPTDEPDPDEHTFVRADMTDAQQARADLAALASSRGLELQAVADAFAQTYASDIGSADAGQVREFTTKLQREGLP
ncbi:MAG: ERF family protein [Gammaproteobacteria bacterium]